MQTIISRLLIFTTSILFLFQTNAQENDSIPVYKKRVLENIEVDFLSSYYSQDGKNAAVTGGIGTEELTDVTAAIIVSIPLNDDDVLTIDAGISAYTSASSSNVNPFDGGQTADPFVASSGASNADVWSNLTLNYSHSSNDRNDVVTGKLSVSSEYDYFSLGFGGGYTKLLNQKNTSLNITANVFFDKWNAIYPSELRPFKTGGKGLSSGLFIGNTLLGNQNYNPSLKVFSDEKRNSYAVGASVSQILSKKLQGVIVADVVKQQGLLSTPFQRVYFNDVADTFIQNFHLAEANEILPDSRLKVAIGGRLNYYFNETFVIRTYYRYFFDDWGIKSNTASIEIPIKIADKFTLYPSYRYYQQTAADYFKEYNQHLSTSNFYTSDYDLSKYTANQYGFGVSYTDIFTSFNIWKFGLKSIDLKWNNYKRSTGLTSNIASLGFKFVLD